jgi:uncharacterized membrane protein
MLCYIPELGWIASVLFLASESHKHDRYVRFHAFQGLFLQAAALVLRFVFTVGGPFHVFPFRHMGIRAVLQILVVVAQVVGIIKTVQYRPYRLPVVGDLAEKSMA